MFLCRAAVLVSSLESTEKFESKKLSGFQRSEFSCSRWQSGRDMLSQVGSYDVGIIGSGVAGGVMAKELRGWKDSVNFHLAGVSE